MVTTLGECMQHALKQGKSEGKSHSISLLTSVIELPRTVFQEYTINTVNTKLLHQILSSVCLKARHDVNFCSFCNWQHHIILKAWTLLLVSTATKTVSLMLFAQNENMSLWTYFWVHSANNVCKLWFLLCPESCIQHCNHQLFPPLAHYCDVSDVIHLAQKRPLYSKGSGFSTLCMVFNCKN